MANQGMYREGGVVAGGLPLPRERIVPLTIVIGVAAFLAIGLSLLFFNAIGHGPTGAWMLFRNGGWPMYLILLSDIGVPILIAVFGAFLVRGKRVPAGIVFACAAIPFALALFGAWVGQTMTIGAISGESVDPEQKARILAEGVAEAMSNDIFGGLVACGAAIAATLAASSMAASIDVAMASKGERPKSFGAMGAGIFGAAWLVATIVIGMLRAKSASPFVLLPALPLLVIVPFAVLAGRGAAVVRGWHDRAEGSRVAGALLVAGISALLAVLALQRGIEASYTSQALSAISGESIDPSQRARILMYSVDAGRMAPAAYAVHAVLGAATFGVALAPAIGGGKHPATPSAIVAVVIGLLLLGGAFSLSRTRESVPRAFMEAARASTPGGVTLPEVIEAFSDKQSGSAGYGARLVVTKDGSNPEPPPSTAADKYNIFADKAATLAMVRAGLPQNRSSKVTLVTTRGHPPEVAGRIGYLTGYLGNVGYVSATVDDEPDAPASPWLSVVSLPDGAIEIEGVRHSLPLSEDVGNEHGLPPNRRAAHYSFRLTDTVERAVRIIVEVEKSNARRTLAYDFDRVIIIVDPARPKKKLPGEGIGLGVIGAGLGGPPSDGKSAPSIRVGATSVNGRLPPEVIQRIVRQNFGRFRLCYENGLRSNPQLTGRVTVKFVIDRSGNVSTAQDGGSTVPDQAVVACIVRQFGNLTFPQPEGGIVTVVYPLDLTPAK